MHQRGVSLCQIQVVTAGLHYMAVFLAFLLFHFFSSLKNHNEF